ncbi:MAG: hypothetical protein NC131_19800, partial [Roseburia sp.]|nr:hypothetical protein [Roseburia sp.]
MHAAGTAFLGYAGYGQEDFLAGGGDKIGKLVHYHYQIGQIAVAGIGAQFTVDKFFVVSLNLAHIGIAEQVVAAVHLHAQRVEGGQGLLWVGDDGFVLLGQLGHKVGCYLVVELELHGFGVYKHKLELVRVLRIEKRCYQAVETHRFTLTGGTGHKQVRHLGEVFDKHLVRYGGSEGYWQVHLCAFDAEGIALKHFAH